MYHTIEFHQTLALDVEISRKQPLERVSLKQGTRLRAQIRPYVVETEDGLIEMADLFFEDGSATRGIRFAYFSFVE